MLLDTLQGIKGQPLWLARLSSKGEPPVDLKAVKTTLHEFVAVRNWQPFHAPKNLGTTLMAEATEHAVAAKLIKNASKHPVPSLGVGRAR